MWPEQTVDARTSEFLTYSQQYAYKALRHLTLDKSLNFKTKMWIETSDKSRASTDRSIVDTDDKSDVAESESPESGTRSPEFPFFLEVQKRLKETLDINVEKHKYKLLRSSSDKSSMIPAKSLAKSAFSTKFARYEIWESPSASILDAIPKVSCFRRKNCDRCLSCMHKSRRKMDEIKDISSRTTPLTKIEGKDDSESSSDELPEFSGELRKIYLRKKVKYREKIEDLSSKSMSDEQHRVEQEDTVISMKIDSDQSKGKTPKPTENLLSKDSKSLKAISSSISISSEKSKVSSSDAHTSDDETSSPLALDNDPSQYKNMAPCHLPTILLPSMEPLRALKYRKATTMEARIALMESVTSTKEKSDEEYYDDIKPATSKISKDKRKVAEKSEEIDDEKDMSLKSPRVLLKVKSEQQLISSIAEPTRKGELKRGYSYMGIKNLSKDSTRSTFETPRSEEEDGREKVIFLEKVDSAKELASSGLVEAEKGAELPLLTVAEISRFLKKVNLKDASAAIMLQILANEFSSRVIKQHDADSTAVIRRAKLAARLTKLLANSKRYLSPDKFPSDLVFSAKQPPVCNSRLLRRILPLNSYNLVAPLLGMPNWYPKETPKGVQEIEDTVRLEDEDEVESETPFSLVVHPPTSKDISTSGDEHKVGQARSNPYALFLKKPRRKAVTWRPLTATDLKDYDPEATLEMRARNITDRICRDFCQWLRGLGGTNKVIDEEVLRDMFEIDFTADASRTTQMSIKEMPMVPDKGAAARQCLDAGELAMTRKHLIRDAKAESRPAKTMAFGCAIPWEHQFVPPGNRVRERWLHCENVTQDVETMDVVWKGITHLDSVKTFAKWLQEQPTNSLPNVLMKAITDFSRHPVNDEDLV
ncbi:titin homolog [Linepithema humile]|uniref:titin homolog n=1 Tax=Linepithema humile TaxID=83485 RepID=UPI00351E4CC0